MSAGEEEQPKPLFWMGSTHKDLKAFPAEVRQAVGFALFQAQMGRRHVNAKILKGFGGAGVLEVVSDYIGDTYRAVYTVKLAGAVYALHAFQKKSKKGIKTPPADLEIVRKRLREAQEQHAKRTAQEGKRSEPDHH
jgi:phage-related protein